MMKFGDGRDWIFKNRFGMFVHWGIYAVPGWHEQILWRRKMDPGEYESYAEVFNPVDYDPEEWLDLMEEAGMEYICFTTKHHDGFCMWDTKQTRYNIMNTPYGKDVLKMLTDACHKRGIKVGLYYSCVDWHHPYYPNLGRSHELDQPKPGDQPDLNGYYNEYVVEQIKELCTNYGTIHHFFWDMNVTGYENPQINNLIRQLQPNVVINDRGPDQGDYSTPERKVPEGKAFKGITEACQSVGKHSWGYKQDEDYYSIPFLINSIDKIMCMGGNYLLNVGPNERGVIPEESKAILRGIGQWYHKVKEAFDDTVTASDLLIDKDILLTRQGSTLYVHIPIPAAATGVILAPIDILPFRTTLLNMDVELDAKVDITPYYYNKKPYLRIRGIPVDQIKNEVIVIKLEFEEGALSF